MRKLNSEVLDLLENRLLQGMLGEVELSASVMDIIRRVLVDNGRLVTAPEHDGESEYLQDEDNLVPFPVRK